MRVLTIRKKKKKNQQAISGEGSADKRASKLMIGVSREERVPEKN